MVSPSILNVTTCGIENQSCPADKILHISKFVKLYNGGGVLYNNMKVKLVFDAQFCGRMESVVDVPDDATEEDIQKLFPSELGLEYDENCHIEKCPTVVKWLFKNGSSITPVIEGKIARSCIYGREE